MLLVSRRLVFHVRIPEPDYGRMGNEVYGVKAAMNRTLRALAGVAPALGFALFSQLTSTGVVQGGELPLQGVEGLCLQRPSSTSPATRVESWTGWGQLLRLSETRWLALLSEARARVDRWADPKRIEDERRARGVTSAKFELLEKQWALAVVDRAGRVRQRSPASEAELLGKTFASLSPGETRWSRPILLAMEESETCAYAVVTRRPAKLHCYDIKLAPTSLMELPVEFVSGARVQREGNTFTLWVFGNPPHFAGGEQRTSSADPSFGFRLPLATRRAESLPLRGAALLEELRGKAKDREGRRLAVDLRTLDVAPFSDHDDHVPLRVLVRAETELSGPPHRRGVWWFFHTKLDPEGVRALEPLPLWIEHGGSETVVDERRATVKVPAGSQLFDIEAFSLNEERSGLYLHVIVPETPPEASSPPGAGSSKSWIALQLVAVFTKGSLHRVFLLEEELLHDSKLTRSLATRTHELLPTLYLGRPGGARELAFHSLSFAKHKGGPQLPCAAVLAIP